MPRHRATLRVLILTIALCAAGGPDRTDALGGGPSEPAERKRVQKVSVEDLWFKTSSPTYTGWIHEGCVRFADPEGAVSRGPITKVDVYVQGGQGYINGIRLWYGKDGVGLTHGYSKDVPPMTWTVPDGERITRVEGQIHRYYISRLQFFTDAGHSSPVFGGMSGKTTPFVVEDPGKGALRTITGHANLRRHPSLNRALASMTFHFGAPYFIKSIDYDLAALDAARLETPPERCAAQDFSNKTSVEQSSTYANSLTVVKTSKLTFEQSVTLAFSQTTVAEASAKILGLGVGGSASVSWGVSTTAGFGQTYSTTREETVSWSVPVRVPPNTRVVATSTWRKYPVRIPFTYTIAWYEGTKDNIKKEVTLPGLYEDVRVDDLKHDFAESPLK